MAVVSTSRLAALLNGVVQNVTLWNETVEFEGIWLGNSAEGVEDGTELTKAILDNLLTDSHASGSDNQTITAGAGLTGGGAGASVTVDIGAGTGMTVNADDIAIDFGTTGSKAISATDLAATTTGKGAALIGIEDVAAQFTGTTVEAGLTESLDAAQAAQADIDAHKDGAANKHDATEVDYERVDGSKKNIDAASDNVETALTDLDDAIGALAGAPTNYTPTDATITADHLAGIDTKLGALDSTINNFEWQASALDYVVNNTVVPATEVSGDRYILSHDGGAPHANWDGALAGDIVEFNGTIWTAVTPTTGTFIGVDDDTSGLYLWGGSAYTFKSFEATTASGGLTKTGFDITITAAGVTAAKLGSDVAGTGLTGGNGAAIDVDFGVAGSKAVSATDLASTANAKGASLIGVEDAAGNYTNTTVETVLTEIDGRLDILEADTDSEAIIKSFTAGQSFSINTTYTVRMAVSGETDGRVYAVGTTAALGHPIGAFRPTSAITAGTSIDITLLGEIISSTAFTAAQDEGKPVFADASGNPTLTAPSTGANIQMGSVSLVGAAGTAKILVQSPRLIGIA